MFIQKNIPFTCLEIGNYCIDQDIEICGIQLNHDRQIVYFGCTWGVPKSIEKFFLEG